MAVTHRTARGLSIPVSSSPAALLAASCCWFALVTLRGALLLVLHWHRLADRPDETNQFATHGYHGLLPVLAPSQKMRKAPIQPSFRLAGERHDRRRLVHSALGQDAAAAGPVAVMPAGLDQNEARVPVAGLGDAAAMLTAGAAIAQAAQPAGAAPAAPAPRHGHRMMMQTENRSDVQAHVAKMFARFDTNRDGFVTKAEVSALETQRAQKMQQRQAQRAARFDPSKMFDRLDSNRDGKITQAEADAARSARIQAKGGKPAQAHATAFGGLFARADTNKDGVITRAEFDVMAQQMHARMEQATLHRGLGGRMFDVADTNKDGRVSLAEMQSLALQHFDRMDLNHDGKLTPDERKQARQAFRAKHRPA